MHRAPQPAGYRWEPVAVPDEQDDDEQYERDPRLAAAAARKTFRSRQGGLGWLVLALGCHAPTLAILDPICCAATHAPASKPSARRQPGCALCLPRFRAR